MKKKIPCDIICPVWGKKYLQLFLKYSLSTHIARPNLEGLKKYFHPTYVIYCTASEKKLLDQSDFFLSVQSIIPFEFRIFSFEKDAMKYSSMVYCHRDAVERAYKKRGGLIFLAPDNVLSKNSLAHIAEIASRGKHLILSPGIRLSWDRWEANVSKYLPNFSENFENYSYQELMECGRKSLHPFIRNLCWSNKNIAHWTSHLYWKLDENSILIRGFHIHPVYMFPEKKTDDSTSIDFLFLQKCCPNRKNWHFIRSSKEFIHFDITAENQQNEIFLKRKSLIRISYWMHQYTFPHHREFILHPYIFECSNPNKEWEIIKKQSYKVIRKLLFLEKLQHFLFFPLNWIATIKKWIHKPAPSLSENNF